MCLCLQTHQLMVVQKTPQQEHEPELGGQLGCVILSGFSHESWSSYYHNEVLECHSKCRWLCSSDPLDLGAGICSAYPSPLYIDKCRDTAFLPAHVLIKDIKWPLPRLLPGHTLRCISPIGLSHRDSLGDPGEKAECN